MNKFKKFVERPTTIDAYQWSSPHGEDGIVKRDYDGYYVTTTGHRHLVEDGDWIIRKSEGEHYPMKPADFNESYEPFGRPTEL